MKIVGSHTVETIEHDGEVYERTHGSGWKIHMGESMEQVYADREDKLEREYMKTFYRRLEHGEIVQEGDEIDRCGDYWRDMPVWEPVHPSNYGAPAPDPQYPAHRKYRRKIQSA